MTHSGMLQRCKQPSLHAPHVGNRTKLPAFWANIVGTHQIFYLLGTSQFSCKNYWHITSPENGIFAVQNVNEV